MSDRGISTNLRICFSQTTIFLSICYVYAIRAYMCMREYVCIQERICFLNTPICLAVCTMLERVLAVRTTRRARSRGGGRWGGGIFVFYWLKTPPRVIPIISCYSHFTSTCFSDKPTLTYFDFRSVCACYERMRVHACARMCACARMRTPVYARIRA